MANPQKEEGFTPTADSILDALYRHPFSSACQMRVLLWVIRNTYGYNRTWTGEPTIREWAQLIKMPHQSLFRVLEDLERSKMVTRKEGKIRIQKDYDLWTQNRAQKRRRSRPAVPSTGHRGLSRPWDKTVPPTGQVIQNNNVKETGSRVSVKEGFKDKDINSAQPAKDGRIERTIRPRFSIKKTTPKPIGFSPPISGPERPPVLNDFIQSAFDTFWRAYPRHVNRKKAFASFKKINPSIGQLETILAALEAQGKSRQWQTKEYIPHPTTWLNGERWNDEVEADDEPEAYDWRDTQIKKKS
jgi:hypothetical protein